MAGYPTLLEFQFMTADRPQFALGTGTEISDIRIQFTKWVLESRLVRACEEGEDYRFGFNGQEKVNEIAGIGNHYTALHWEYDPRTARRWNLDPVPQISINDYSVLGLNPINNTDPLGDIFNKWDTKSSKNEYKFNGYYATNTKYFADEANLNSFAKAAIELATDNIIFAQVYTQLSKSKNLYTIQQEYTNTANYKSETKTINMKYRGVGKDAYIAKTEVFEEVFHAGQDEYYSARGVKRSHLEDEVEAKVADIISGHQDDAVNGEYKSIKGYFKTGKKDKGFSGELDKLIGDVYDHYSKYDNTEGKKWGKENDPKKVDKKNVLNYLETLTPATKDK